MDDTTLLEEFNRQSDHSLISALGIRFTSLQPERVEAVMPVDQRTCQPFGILHVGASLALAETMAGAGSLLLLDTDEMAVGVEVTGNHVASVPLGNEVHAVATLIHRGRSTHLWNVDIYRNDDQLAATVRVLNAIRTKKISSR